MKTRLLFLCMTIVSAASAQITINESWSGYTPDGDQTKYRIEFDFNDPQDVSDDTMRVTKDFQEIYRGRVDIVDNGVDTMLLINYSEQSGSMCFDTTSLDRYYIDLSYQGKLMSCRIAGFESDCIESDSIFDRLIWGLKNWTVPDSVFDVGQNDTTDTSGGVGIVVSNRNSSLRAYPNPSNGVFRVDSGTENPIHFYDSIGRLILSQELTKGINHVEIKTTGIYFGVAGNDYIRVVVR